MIVALQIRLKDVILEKAKLLKAIWEDHEPNPILDALKPESSIDVAVNPVHFTITLTKVLLIISFKDVPTFPVELSIAVFLVPAVLTLELIANSLYLA